MAKIPKLLAELPRQLPRRLSLLTLLLLMSVTAGAQQENMDTLFDIHHDLAYLVAALLITIFVLIFSNRLIYYRSQEVVAGAQRLNDQVALIMSSNKTEAWTYDPLEREYRVLSDRGQTETTYTPIDFSQFYDRDDFQGLREAMQAILSGEELSGTRLVRGAAPKESWQKQRTYEINVSILRRDRHNAPTMLLGTQRDVTEDQERTERSRQLALQFHTVFESSLVDMIYFDADGTMLDMNDKACESYFVKDRREMLANKPNIYDFPSLRDIDFKDSDEVHMSSLVDLTKVARPIGDVSTNAWGGTKSYYEREATLVRNQEGEKTGIVMAGRNITDMVNSQHHQREAAKLLEQRTREIQEYIRNINFSLKVSDVRLMNYYPDTHELEISSDMNRTQYRLSQIRSIALISPEDRLRARGMMRRMDKRREGIISERLHTTLRDKDGRDVYLNFNVMPIKDKDGRVTHYFGMCRNETEMTYTERQLKQETEKAQEAEQLKTTFLLNMSYELRTPLNAVVGFAELFASEHSEEDEPIFAEEIKKNTNTLLKLINDILFLSRLDARMIEYDYQPADFAMLFDGWCYMGWSNLTPGVKAVVENPYSSLIVDIDQQNLGMVIQKICVFSGLVTTEGTVRAKYEYRRGELMITIEDTSQGMSGETLAKVFDRFSRQSDDEEGTGLDLPIVKELLEQMNGSIELQSEPGKGNTFFVSVPCKMVSFDKKAEILT